MELIVEVYGLCYVVELECVVGDFEFEVDLLFVG